MPDLINNLIKNKKEPLVEYPWYSEVDRLLSWLTDQDPDMKCFCFDVLMSLAFIDSTAGLEKSLEFCPNCPGSYDLHIGFINLCAPCYINNQRWTYQKAAKPQSGVLGKLSSEVILRFIHKSSNNFTDVYSVGGVNSIDAVLIHKDGLSILAEVKSAPLTTYPILFSSNLNADSTEFHSKSELTNSQFRELESALYLHDNDVIPLGKPKSNLWPFKQAVDYFLSIKNKVVISKALHTWQRTKNAYSDRTKDDPTYYLANASGSPPNIAKTRDSWPISKTISDGKTSVGMDRTDDIKKGIYQSLKIATLINNDDSVIKYKTAIVSNLPAYRHGRDYVEPFIDMLWGKEEYFVTNNENKEYSIIHKDNLNRVFDYIITIDKPILRNLKL